MRVPLQKTCKSVSPISEIVQNNEGGLPEKILEIKTHTDPQIQKTNYHLYKYNLFKPDKEKLLC
jgi:hypothetical protein